MMEWLVGIVSVLVSISVSIAIARWSDSQQEKRFERELAEVRRQWEETAGAIQIEVDYRPHQQDRRRDQLEIIVTNPGRMPVYVREVSVTDEGQYVFVPLHLEGDEMRRIEPNEPLILKAHRGTLEDHGRKSRNPEEWFDELVVLVKTGDGRSFWWNPVDGTRDRPPIE